MKPKNIIPQLKGKIFSKRNLSNTLDAVIDQINHKRTLIGTAIAITLSSYAISKVQQQHFSRSKITETQPFSEPKILQPKQKLDQLISEIEISFHDLEFQIMPLIEELEDETLKANLMGPFQIMKFNQENPDKNFLRLKQKMDQQNTQDYKSDQQNPYIFNYTTNNNIESAAEYSPLSKTIILPENFDPENLSSKLTLFHELKHVIQDTNARLQNKTEQQHENYLNFYSSPESANIFINNEIDAYAYQIELLNLLTNNELLNAAQENREVSDDIIKNITQNDQDAKELEFIIALSKLYFPSRINEIVLNPDNPFTQTLIELYQKSHRKIWVKLANGDTVEYSTR